MSTASPLSFYLITEKMATSFTGVLSATPTDPYMSIAYNTGVVGSQAPLPGMTVSFGTSAGARDLGTARLRSFNGTTTGIISVGENDDVTPYLASGQFVKISSQFRLWPIFVKTTLVNGVAYIYIDYDVTYSDQTRLWKPVAAAGPPAVSEYNGTNFTAKFVGDRSFALAPGATLTGFLWTAPGSVEGTSISQGTEASPVIFTWTSTGQKLVYLRVTDSNGKTATNYTWAFGVDPANPATVAYTDFDAYNDNFDRGQGGGSCSFTVHGNASVANFPNETLVIMASTGDKTTPTATWPFRSNIEFYGFIKGDSVRQNSINGDVSFQAATIDDLMKNLSVFPASLTNRIAPSDWTMAANLTTDRAASFLWHYYSTLSLMASIVPSNYAGLIQRQDFGPNSGIYGQLDSELMKSLWAKVVVNHQGIVHHRIDYNLMLNAERAAVTVRKTLQKGIWIDDLTIEERNAYSLPTSKVNMSGVAYPGGEIDDVCPLFSEAPGDVPKFFGREANVDRLILTNQTDLNIRCGRQLAKDNAPYAFSMRFINDGSFTIAPQELFPTVIEAGDNTRGLALTPRLLPSRISRTFDNELGYISYDVTFEMETDGPPGITVDMDCTPPEQRQNNNRPPGPPSGNNPSSSLVASTEGESFYFAQVPGSVWQRRVNGLTSLDLRDLIKDPWSNFKNGQNINQIILWGCGPGFLTRSPDTGENWEDHTPYLDAPPNSWGDVTPPNVSGTVVKQVLGNLFREDEILILAQNQGTGTAYRGWVGRSTDAGFTFNWYALTGTPQTYPIRMDIDKQDGTLLWVTTWENGSLFLRKHSLPTMALTTKYPLVTGTAIGSVFDNTSLAYPFTPLGNKNKIYAYGRMAAPQGLGGTQAIIKSDNAGGAWASLVNDWSNDYCGAFHSDEAGQLYAVRNAATVNSPGTVSPDAGTYIVVQQMSSTRALVGYVNSSSAAVIALIDTSTAPPSVITSSTLTGGNKSYLSMNRVDATRALIGYRTATGPAVQAQLVEISGASLNLGSAATVASATVVDVSVAALSTTKGVITYTNSGSSDRGQGAVLDLTLGTLAVTPNSVQEYRAPIGGASIAGQSVCKIDATTALVCSAVGLTISDSRLRCNVLDDITTAWTLGADTDIDTNAAQTISPTALAYISDGNAVVGFNAYTVGPQNVVQSYALSVSGAVVSAGAVNTVDSEPSGIQVPQLGVVNGTILCTYQRVVDGYCYKASLGANGASAGSTLFKTTAGNLNAPGSGMGGTSVIAYQDTGDGNKVKIQVV